MKVILIFIILSLLNYAYMCFAAWDLVSMNFKTWSELDRELYLIWELILLFISCIIKNTKDES